MPTLPLAASACDDGCPTIGMTISPSGKILAVSWGTGVQFFHFNGANQPAEAIAQAAQAFGQDDDITVLTLTFVTAAVPA